MKRFYKDVATGPSGDGFGILLDGRPIKTPARAALVLPHTALAEAVAEEWRVQGEEIDAASMVMTGFANAAIDRVAPDREAFAQPIAAYAETDMLCYRAEAGDLQAEKQDAEWEPLLRWAEQRYDVAFTRIAGISYQDQPAATLARMSEAVLAQDDFTLAAMQPLTTISGSLVCVLAFLEGQIDTSALWPIVNLEELWQAELWGEDAEALATREANRVKFEAAARFCELARENA
ncbi:ATP12 family protein [Sphingorhabdus sp. Alg239-R122]|uniref:ATP12 family chaperone protein n=1 Tax=Sphingorhabdus sp. Alg239-R122 TaxID=2305989 RepID=UPI0013DA5937|nr:ATP12 family protein [Sphingorhabdus sp. Alg239-R122]